MEKNRIVKRINALTVGERAHCGDYGTVTCTRSAHENGRRAFKVTGSKLIRNGGNWRMASLREAIEG